MTEFTEEMLLGSPDPIGTAQLRKSGGTNVKVSIYEDLREVTRIVRGCKDVGICIFITPTTERPHDIAEWQALAMTMTDIVRCGGKLITVSGPRGEQAWEKNRRDVQEMINIIKASATAMQKNVVAMFSEVPSLSEPFTCLGESTRPSASSAYPAYATKSFLPAVQKYVTPYSKKNLFKALQEPISRKKAYREEHYNSHHVNINYSNRRFDGYRGGRYIKKRSGRGRGFSSKPNFPPPTILIEKISLLRTCFLIVVNIL
ncbi:hypothetical protein Q1695_009082 [Nippostrongylus brasiliensis]|nr:hypothetical protein Q1695_009082 [Nippostrongylus brasiliensis]